MMLGQQAHNPSRLELETDYAIPSSADLLNRVTYRVGQGHELSVQANSMRFGDARAVALIDTIVFASSWDAENNDVLWAHEMKHVEQYHSWGLSDFAKRYVRNWQAVENDAARAENAYAQLRHRFTAPPTQRRQLPPARFQPPPTPPQFARICATPYGVCQMGVAIPLGSSCYCMTPQGQIWGVGR